MHFLGWTLGLALAMTAPAGALTLPSNGTLDFDVMRNGRDIGDHNYRFSGMANQFTVTVSTNIEVRLPLIRTRVYSFSHASTETWQSGDLRALTSSTNDDGEPYRLNAGPSTALPASLWNDDTIRSARLLNTIDGTMMNIRVADLGQETVSTNRGNVSAHHYRLSGDLARDLWYDGDGNLAQVVFKADDGSTVTYTRK